MKRERKELKIRYNIIASVIVAILLSSLLMPFYISADQSLPSPFIGFNVNYIDVEVDDEYQTSIAGTTGTYTGTVARHTASVSMTGDFTGIERTSSGVTYITTETSVGSVNGVNTQTGTVTENAAAESGTISLNLSSTSNITTNENGIIEVEIILDDYYVGNFDLTFKYGNVSYLTKTIYVNGNSCKFTYTSFGSLGTNATLNNYTITINSFSLNSSLYRQWYYPFESFMFVNYLSYKENLPISYIKKYNDYIYPVFDFSKNIYLFRTVFGRGGQGYKFIFLINKYIVETNFNNFFTISSGLTFQNFQLLDRVSTGLTGDDSYLSLISFELVNNGTENIFNAGLYYNNNSNAKIMPIYCNKLTYRNISTDFALQFGLTNDLLDNINTIANGTTASNNSSSQLDTNNNQFASDSQQLMNIESGYNNDLNNQLHNIDFTNPISNNPNMLSSAGFVVNIFNSLINNNPLSIFIIIICVVLVGKRLFGK